MEGLWVILSVNKFNVENIFMNDVFLKEFWDCFEKVKILVVVSECYDNYILVWLCSFFKLFKDRYFECGEDSDGYLIEIKLKDFLIYMRWCKDWFLLYIFDVWIFYWKGVVRK